MLVSYPSFFISVLLCLTVTMLTVYSAYIVYSRTLLKHLKHLPVFAIYALHATLQYRKTRAFDVFSICRVSTLHWTPANATSISITARRLSIVRKTAVNARDTTVADLNVRVSRKFLRSATLSVLSTDLRRIAARTTGAFAIWSCVQNAVRIVVSR